MEPPTQAQLIRLVMSQFRPPFTPDAIAAVEAAGVRIEAHTEQLEMNHIFFAIVFEHQGQEYALTNTELVHDEEKGWVCFFDGSGPNDSYCEQGPDGRYRIIWM